MPFVKLKVKLQLLVLTEVLLIDKHMLVELIFCVKLVTVALLNARVEKLLKLKYEMLLKLVEAGLIWLLLSM